MPGEPPVGQAGGSTVAHGPDAIPALRTVSAMVALSRTGSRSLGAGALTFFSPGVESPVVHDETPARTYHLPSPVDLQATLGSLGIDHLVVTPTRLFVIFRTAVLDCRVRQGDLETAGVVSLTVLDGPSRSTEPEAALRDRLLEQLALAGTD